MTRPELIYLDGAMVPYADATIHVSSVAAKYGANVFEGLCAHAAASEQSFVFRLNDHLLRLHRSVRLMEIDCDFDDGDYGDAILRSLRENHIHGDAHRRLTVFITGERSCEGRGPAAPEDGDSGRRATAATRPDIRRSSSKTANGEPGTQNDTRDRLRPGLIDREPGRGSRNTSDPDQS
jgi:branched-subunit amino acid aminotransferase/4-amino-4-deoxychorismate lyase